MLSAVPFCQIFGGKAALDAMRQLLARRALDLAPAARRNTLDVPFRSLYSKACHILTDAARALTKKTKGRSQHPPRV